MFSLHKEFGETHGHTNDLIIKSWTHILVFLDVLNTILLVAKSLRWIVPVTQNTCTQNRSSICVFQNLKLRYRLRLYLHSLLIKFAALLVIFLGNSTISIPLRIMLYVFMGSDPEKGGLEPKEENWKRQKYHKIS